MSRGIVALSVTGLTALVPGGVASAGSGAATASPAVLQQNWYWHKLNADAPAAGVPDPGEPSQVPAGDLPAASRNGSGTPSKLPIVAFDLPADALGGTVSAFTVTLTLDPSATQVMTDTPKLVAALARRNWANGAGGEADTGNAPPVDAASEVPGVLSADGRSYSFAVPALAQAWVDDSNFGLEILPAKGYTTPFQVSFLGGKAVKATMAYTPAVPVNDAPASVPAAAAPPASSAGSGPSLPVPAAAAGLPVGTAPLLTGSVPVTAPQVVPQVQPGAPAVAPVTTPVAVTAALRKVSSAPGAGLIGVGVALAVLLLVVSLVLGGDVQPAAATSRSRLSAVLRQRAAAPAPLRPARA